MNTSGTHPHYKKKKHFNLLFMCCWNEVHKCIEMVLNLSYRFKLSLSKILFNCVCVCKRKFTSVLRWYWMSHTKVKMTVATLGEVFSYLNNSFQMWGKKVTLWCSYPKLSSSTEQLNNSVFVMKLWSESNIHKPDLYENSLF